MTDESLRDRVRVFADRGDAGRALAALLPAPAPDRATSLLAIPAGGVPVAAAVAQALALPLDVAVVSKVTLPWNTEVGFGAVAFDGSERLNERMLARTELTPTQIDECVARTRAKVRRRVERLRGGRPLPALERARVVLIDDGLASGFTMRIAVAALRAHGAGDVTVAVPTAHEDAARALAAEVECLVCANLRRGWRFAVADAYRHWHDVDDAEVERILEARETGRGS